MNSSVSLALLVVKVLWCPKGSYGYFEHGEMSFLFSVAGSFLFNSLLYSQDPLHLACAPQGRESSVMYLWSGRRPRKGIHWAVSPVRPLLCIFYIYCWRCLTFLIKMENLVLGVTVVLVCFCQECSYYFLLLHDGHPRRAGLKSLICIDRNYQLLRVPYRK